MKKSYIFLILLLSVTISFSQNHKGDLLLEGVVSSSWTSLGLLDNTVFGTYITDNLAITVGVSAVFDEDDPITNSTLGIRYHLLSPSFGKNPILYANIVTYSFGGDSDMAWEVGLRNRFYANSWLAFEPGVGIASTAGGPTLLSSFIGIAYIF